MQQEPQVDSPTTSPNAAHGLAVTARLPAAEAEEPGDRRRVAVLIHGAGNSSLVWRYWQAELAARGWATFAIDLRGHGASAALDLSRTRMRDYAADVEALARRVQGLPVLIGWSMGGLVALMVASAGAAAACVALAPSVPAQSEDPSIPLREGGFGPEEYGITSRDPDDQPALPDLGREERLVAISSLGAESRLARDERRRGVVVTSLPCPLLIVTGTADTAWPRARYRNLWLPSEHLSVEGASHWGLVLNRRALTHVVPAVVQWATALETPRSPVSPSPGLP